MQRVLIGRVVTQVPFSRGVILNLLSKGYHVPATLEQPVYFMAAFSLQQRLSYLHRFLRLPLMDYVSNELKNYNSALHFCLRHADHRLAPGYLQPACPVQGLCA